MRQLDYNEPLWRDQIAQDFIDWARNAQQKHGDFKLVYASERRRKDGKL